MSFKRTGVVGVDMIADREYSKLRTPEALVSAASRSPQPLIVQSLRLHRDRRAGQRSSAFRRRNVVLGLAFAQIFLQHTYRVVRIERTPVLANRIAEAV